MKGLTYRESRCSLAVHWRKILVGWLQLRHQHVIGNCLLLHKDRDKLATSHWSAMALRTHIALGRRRGHADDKRPRFSFQSSESLGKRKVWGSFPTDRTSHVPTFRFTHAQHRKRDRKVRLTHRTMARVLEDPRGAAETPATNRVLAFSRLALTLSIPTECKKLTSDSQHKSE